MRRRTRAARHYVCVFVSVRVFVRACVCACVHVCTYICVQTNTYTYISHDARALSARPPWCSASDEAGARGEARGDVELGTNKLSGTAQLRVGYGLPPYLNGCLVSRGASPGKCTCGTMENYARFAGGWRAKAKKSQGHLAALGRPHHRKSCELAAVEYAGHLSPSLKVSNGACQSAACLACSPLGRCSPPQDSIQIYLSTS